MNIGSLHITNSIHTLGWNALDWFFPPECVRCGNPGRIWCTDCQKEVEIVQASVCPICGSPGKSATICSVCQQVPPKLDWIRSWAVYTEPIKKIIHALKYRNQRSLAPYFSTFLHRLYQSAPQQVDFITAVPLSKERMRTRGYNQAAIVAKALQSEINLTFHPEAINRIRHTESQVGKTVQERTENVSGAFQSSPMIVQNKNVLILDDVYTTGATLNACANALRKAGARCVIGITIARAGLYQHQTNELLD